MHLLVGYVYLRLEVCCLEHKQLTQIYGFHFFLGSTEDILDYVCMYVCICVCAIASIFCSYATFFLIRPDWTSLSVHWSVH